MLSYANLTKSVDEIRKFCSVLISCWNRTEQNMRLMFMRWNWIFFLWNETESNFYFMRWNRIKFLFCEMRQNQILILWDEMRLDFFSWDEMRWEMKAALMRWDQIFVRQNVPFWFFSQSKNVSNDNQKIDLSFSDFESFIVEKSWSLKF